MISRRARAFVAILLFTATSQSFAKDAKHCALPEAEKLLAQGMSQQAELDTESALDTYLKCLAIEPGCVACRYERGWSYWKLGKWEEVIRDWEDVLHTDPAHTEARQFLPSARENLAVVRNHKMTPSFRSGVEIGTRSKPEGGPVSLLFSSRRQSYDRTPESPLDHFDPEIQSPKSVRFSPDGKRVYVNSLEAGKTVVFDALGFTKVAAIQHKFGEQDAGLFDRKAIYDYRFLSSIKHPNQFFGKPVELELTHGGRFLWAPYYRRSFDAHGTMPSAVAIIDTATNSIVRVLGTGPISKYVRASPRGTWMAVSHWGDNSVGLIDIRGDDPKKFKRAELLVVETRLKLTHVTGDRDKDCGFCVRGLAFTSDEKYLFVSRMKGGGIAAFELGPKRRHKYLGTIFGILPGPRDLEVSANGAWLYASCNASGFTAKIPMPALLDVFRAMGSGKLKAGQKREVTVDRTELGVKTAYVGIGARSIRLSPDESYLFVAVNQTSEVVIVSTDDMKVQARIPVDSYPVGLDLSPDGLQLWVTSQGRESKGGNSVGIFQVRYKAAEVIHADPTPASAPSLQPQ